MKKYKVYVDDEQTMGCDDVILWPDGTWCYVNEFQEYTFMSDDFEVISQGTLKYMEFHKELDNA